MTDMNRSTLNTEDIIVSVGSDSQIFTLPRDVLTEIFPDMDLDYEAASSDFSCWDPNIFALFEKWLYSRTLADLSEDDEEEAKDLLRQYLEMYFLATIWNVQDLENLIMDKIRDRHTCEDGYFPRSLIKSVYENTEPGSVLREYVADSFLYKSVLWGKEVRHELIKRHLDYGNTDFVYETIVAFDDVEDLLDILHPNRDMDRGYHNHREGRECKV